MSNGKSVILATCDFNVYNRLRAEGVDVLLVGDSEGVSDTQLLNWVIDGTIEIHKSPRDQLWYATGAKGPHYAHKDLREAMTLALRAQGITP